MMEQQLVVRYFIVKSCKCHLGFQQRLIIIIIIRLWRDLEIWVRGRSRSLEKVPFDRLYTTYYWSAIVSITVSCTIFEIFDVE